MMDAKKTDARACASKPTQGKAGGLRVRSDVRAGDWSCQACQGKVMGNQLFKASCSYCEKI